MATFSLMYRINRKAIKLSVTPQRRLIDYGLFFLKMGLLAPDCAHFSVTCDGHQ